QDVGFDHRRFGDGQRVTADVDRANHLAGDRERFLSRDFPCDSNTLPDIRDGHEVSCRHMRQDAFLTAGAYESTRYRARRQKTASGTHRRLRIWNSGIWNLECVSEFWNARPHSKFLIPNSILACIRTEPDRLKRPERIFDHARQLRT